MAIDRSHAAHRGAKASAVIQALFGRRQTLVGAVVVAAAAATVGLVTPTSASSSDRYGTFKVVNGHVQQKVKYVDTYRTWGDYGCSTYTHSDAGRGNYYLAFVRGDRTPLLDEGGVSSLALRLDGGMFRTWSEDVTTTAGPNAGADYCDDEPPLPPLESDCGGDDAVAVERAKTALYFARASRAGVDYMGSGLALQGAFLDEDPLPTCWSDSLYGLLALDAISQGGAKKLDKAKVGTRVRLAGRNSLLDEPGPDGFGVGAGEYEGEESWVSGSQTVEMNWALTLKRVKRR